MIIEIYEKFNLRMRNLSESAMNSSEQHCSFFFFCALIVPSNIGDKRDSPKTQLHG
jgi:hypothetical protein